MKSLLNITEKMLDILYGRVMGEVMKEKVILFFICTILFLGFSNAEPNLYRINSVEFRGVSYNWSWYNKASVPISSIEYKLGQVNFVDAGSELIIENKNNEGVSSNKALQIYKIKNYKIGFRIAVKDGNKYLIFEADVNPKAKYGKDLLDIENKVSYIGISDSGSGLPEYCFIKDSKVIKNIVNMILSSKVTSIYNNSQNNNYYLGLHLKDGTKIIRFFSLEANALDNKILLTKEFGRDIKEAIDEFNLEKHKNYESNNADLKSLNIVLPKNWSLDTSEKFQYYFTDEKGKKSGSIALDDYKDYIAFQQNNHSSMIKDEYINIPVGKCRLITMDCDNGTAASGITGTHNEYFAIIPIKGAATYRLNFSKMDKKKQSKEQFIVLLKNLSLK